jgi:acetate kinase
MKILVLNSGSSSQEACLYDIGGTLPQHPPACLWEGRIEWSNGNAAIAVKSGTRAVWKKDAAITSRAQVVQELLSTAWSGDTRAMTGLADIDTVGHRVVHGGPHFEDLHAIVKEAREMASRALGSCDEQ